MLKVIIKNTLCKTQKSVLKNKIFLKSFYTYSTRGIVQFDLEKYCFAENYENIYIHSPKRHRLVASCQSYRLFATCQFHQAATSLFKVRLIATRYWQTCYNLLKQLAARLWITSFDNQLATSLLTTSQQTCRPLSSAEALISRK